MKFYRETGNGKRESLNFDFASQSQHSLYSFNHFAKTASLKPIAGLLINFRQTATINYKQQMSPWFLVLLPL
jgi:hypothetical protein